MCSKSISVHSIEDLLDDPPFELASDMLIPLVESLHFLECEERTEEVIDLMEEVSRWVIECERFPHAFVTIK